MHDLAVKLGTVNDSQQEEDMQETLKKLELLLISDVILNVAFWRFVLAVLLFVFVFAYLLFSPEKV